MGSAPPIPQAPVGQQSVDPATADIPPDLSNPLVLTRLAQGLFGGGVIPVSGALESLGSYVAAIPPGYTGWILDSLGLAYYIAGTGTRLGAGTLAYAQVTAAQGGITTETDLTGLAVTVTVGVGRRIRVTGYGGVYSSVADDVTELRIKEGASQLQSWAAICRPASSGITAVPRVILTPTAGSHAYKLSLVRAAGTGSLTFNAGPTYPGFILVEDIGT